MSEFKHPTTPKLGVVWIGSKDHPGLLDRLVVMDNMPTRIVARGVLANGQSERHSR